MRLSSSSCLCRQATVETMPGLVSEPYNELVRAVQQVRTLYTQAPGPGHPWPKDREAVDDPAALVPSCLSSGPVVASAVEWAGEKRALGL